MKKILILILSFCLFFSSNIFVYANEFETATDDFQEDSLDSSEIIAVEFNMETLEETFITKEDLALNQSRTINTDVPSYLPPDLRNSVDYSILDEDTINILSEMNLLSTDGDIDYDAVGNLPTLGQSGIIESENDLSSRSVIGSDSRQQINQNYMTSAPYRYNCLLIIQFPNGNAKGTGFMIGSKIVGTAGHCIYDNNLGGWAKNIVVIPGNAGTYRPYGQATSTALNVGGNWYNGRNANDDWGCITLNTNLGSRTGYYGMKVANSSMIGLGGTQITGYPGDLGGGQYQYRDAGSLSSMSNNMWKYQMDTAPGQSGAAISRNNQVIGIHAYGTSLFSNYNSGRVMDQWLFDYFMTMR